MSLRSYLKAGTKSLDNMQELLVEELKDLYDVEQRLIDNLPNMEEAAYDARLKQALHQHYQVTQRQKERLEQCFYSIGVDAQRAGCDGIKGILEEGEVLMKANGNPMVKDAALIGAAQRVEHYEMAAYGTARSLAEHLHLQEVAGLLQETLDEESQADDELTEIALQNINPPGMDVTRSYDRDGHLIPSKPGPDVVPADAARYEQGLPFNPPAGLPPQV